MKDINYDTWGKGSRYYNDGECPVCYGPIGDLYSGYLSGPCKNSGQSFYPCDRCKIWFHVDKHPKYDSIYCPVCKHHQ